MAKKQTKSATKQTTKRLSAPGTAARLYAVLNDQEQPVDALIHAHEWFDQLLNDAGVSFVHPAFFTRGFLMACRKVEATKKPKLSTKNITLWCAHQAYGQIQEILERVAKGETLSDLHAEYERKATGRHAELETERAANK